MFIELDIALLDWYETNKRDLPWRENANPYYIWVSEIMLQQTRVEAVKTYFLRFIQALPTLEDLANTNEDHLLKLWEGLGYYNRVRNMQKCAKMCMELYDSQLPRDYQSLLKLPGIGLYTAGAIASIAYQLPVPAIDGNVMRVFSRLLNNDTDITTASYQKQLYQLILDLIPPQFPGAFNQAIMELGATICIPNGAPLCLLCPLQSYCKGYEEGTAILLPTKKAKKARLIEARTIVVVTSVDGVLLQKRPSTGLLSGMYEFLNLDRHLDQQQIIELDLLSLFQLKQVVPMGESKHIFTHIEWRMIGYYVEVEQLRLPVEYPYFWATKQQLELQYSLPTALKQYKHYYLTMR